MVPRPPGNLKSGSALEKSMTTSAVRLRAHSGMRGSTLLGSTATSASTGRASASSAIAAASAASTAPPGERARAGRSCRRCCVCCCCACCCWAGHGSPPCAAGRCRACCCWAAMRGLQEGAAPSLPASLLLLATSPPPPPSAAARERAIPPCSCARAGLRLRGAARRGGLGVAPAPAPLQAAPSRGPLRPGGGGTGRAGGAPPGAACGARAQALRAAPAGPAGCGAPLRPRPRLLRTP
jgi:hypothetical protein